jgi:AraC-like DNA-binding protein
MNQSFFPLIGSNGNLPLYVTSVGRDNDQPHTKRPDGLQHHQWLYSVEGQGKLLIDGKEFIIGKNTGFFMRPNVPHEYFALQSPWETHWVTFSGDWVSTLMNTLNLGQWGVYHINETKYIDQLLSNILLSVQAKSIYEGYRSSGLLYSFLLEMRSVIQDYGSQDSKIVYKQLESTIDFMEQNIARDMSLSEIADHINVSPQYLCRIFKQKLKISPYEYLIRLRIHKAKEMLINEDALVKDILEYTGFRDASYFTAVFKRYEGMTPAQFRHIHFS